MNTRLPEKQGRNRLECVPQGGRCGTGVGRLHSPRTGQHTLPLQPRPPPPRLGAWRTHDATAVARFLGLGDGGQLPGVDSAIWGPTSIATSAQESSPWWIWRPRHSIEESRLKVYISPHPDQLPLVLPNVTRELDGSRAVGLKIAADAANLLRPDKFMVYFSRVDAANRFARKIAHAVVGVQRRRLPSRSRSTLTVSCRWASILPKRPAGRTDSHPAGVCS